MEVRNALESEIDALAQLWYDGWQDAHAKILPAELARHRTLESFTERLGKHLSNTRVVGTVGEPIGFCIVKGDELHQIFVSAEARGNGVAQARMADAKEHLSSAGVTTAWLGCAIGNERAARFYEKSGWMRAGTFIAQLETPDGIFELEVWRYEKPVGTGCL